MVRTKDFYYTQDEKRDAIKDEEWQQIRLNLKGSTTEMKLKVLKLYYDDYKDSRKVKIIIDNYLKALARGGQLHPGVDIQQAIEKDFKLEVRK